MTVLSDDRDNYNNDDLFQVIIWNIEGMQLLRFFDWFLLRCSGVV